MIQKQCSANAGRFIWDEVFYFLYMHGFCVFPYLFTIILYNTDVDLTMILDYPLHKTYGNFGAILYCILYYIDKCNLVFHLYTLKCSSFRYVICFYWLHTELAYGVPDCSTDYADSVDYNMYIKGNVLRSYFIRITDFNWLSGT